MLADLVDRLAGRRVAVLGDVCLDEYLIGRASRLSREAPVPVLEFDRRFCLPGAAANPARNIRALAGQAAVFGVIGADASGAELRDLLAADGIDVGGLIAAPDRPTSVKTRVVADSDLLYMQQVVRLDRGRREPLGDDQREAMLAALAAMTVDIVLVSDYQAGVVDEPIIARARTMAQAAGVPIAVDSQGDLLRFRGYTLVRSNRAEAEATLRRPLRTDEAIREAIGELRDRLGAAAVVITRGPEGIAAGDSTGTRLIPAANRSEVFDAVGAGDTVIAVLALGVAAGIPIADAAELANAAAGLVVRRFGNAVASPDDLRRVLAE